MTTFQVFFSLFLSKHTQQLTPAKGFILIRLQDRFPECMRLDWICLFLVFWGFFLQASDAEFCGQGAAAGFSHNSSMRVKFVQVWLNSWTGYAVYQEGCCNQTGVLEQFPVSFEMYVDLY